MKYDVVLCTFNGELFIEEQIISILSQKYKPECIYIGDDGSDDKTIKLVIAILKEWRVEYKITLNKERLGYAKNFINQLLLCKSNIIFLSDQDDVWVPNKIEIFEHSISQYKDAQLFFSDAYITDGALNEIESSLWDILKIPKKRVIKYKDGLDKRFYVTGATTAVRKSLLSLPCIKAMPNSVPHDGWLSIVASLTGGVVPIREKLILYRQHGDNLLGIRSKSLWAGYSDYLNGVKRHKRIDGIKGRIQVLNTLIGCGLLDKNDAYLQLNFYALVLEGLNKRLWSRITLLSLYKKYKSFDNVRSLFWDLLI